MPTMKTDQRASCRRHPAFLKLCCALVFLCSLDGLASPSAKINAAPFVEISLAKTVSELPASRYPARVVSPATLDVTSRIDGEIAECSFRNGDLVEAGALLYKLDPVRYEAALQSAEASLLEAQATSTWAQIQYERARNLRGVRAASQEDLDEALKNQQSAQASLLAAQASVTLAKDDLKHTEIRAPFKGRIGVSNLPAGTWVSAASDVLTTLRQTDPVRVRFALSLKDILKSFGSLENLRKHGRVAVLRADGSAMDQNRPIVFLDNAAVSDTDTIDAYAEFDNADDALVVGSTVTALLTQADPVRSLLGVPTSAIQYDSSSAWVWVVDEEMRAHRRTVILGDISGDTQIITSGLQPGERVVSEGTHKVMENGFVRASPSDAKSRDASLHQP